MTPGADSLAAPLREVSIEVAPPTRGRPVDAVLAGWYREFSMEALEAACEAVWQGARLYSCSQSVFFAAAAGRAIGTSRAISAMIRSVTAAGWRLWASRRCMRCAALPGGSGSGPPSLPSWVTTPSSRSRWPHRGNALAVAVGTGIGTASAFDRLPGGRRPHLMLRGVDELLGICQALGGDAATGAQKPRKPHKRPQPSRSRLVVLTSLPSGPHRGHDHEILVGYCVFAPSMGAARRRRSAQPGHRGAQFLHLPGELRDAAPAVTGGAGLGDLAYAPDLAVEGVETAVWRADAITVVTGHDGGADG